VPAFLPACYWHAIVRAPVAAVQVIDPRWKSLRRAPVTGYSLLVE